jgi:hypothetical protein
MFHFKPSILGIPHIKKPQWILFRTAGSLNLLPPHFEQLAAATWRMAGRLKGLRPPMPRNIRS